MENGYSNTYQKINYYSDGAFGASNWTLNESPKYTSFNSNTTSTLSPSKNTGEQASSFSHQPGEIRETRPPNAKENNKTMKQIINLQILKILKKKKPSFSQYSQVISFHFVALWFVREKKRPSTDQTTLIQHYTQSHQTNSKAVQLQWRLLIKFEPTLPKKVFLFKKKKKFTKMQQTV